jgi:hypothetical protein
MQDIFCLFQEIERFFQESIYFSSKRFGYKKIFVCDLPFHTGAKTLYGNDADDKNRQRGHQDKTGCQRSSQAGVYLQFID